MPPKMKASEIQAKLNEDVKSIIGEDSNSFWFSGMMSDRGVPWIQVGSLEFLNSFSIDSKRESDNKELLKNRILETLIEIKNLVEKRIERVKKCRQE